MSYGKQPRTDSFLLAAARPAFGKADDTLERTGGTYARARNQSEAAAADLGCGDGRDNRPAPEARRVREAAALPGGECTREGRRPGHRLPRWLRYGVGFPLHERSVSGEAQARYRVHPRCRRIRRLST